MRLSLSIVMAAYNEAEALPKAVADVLSFLRSHTDHGELIIVDDGSTDGSDLLIDRLALEHKEIIPLHLKRNQGMGAALLLGFSRATRDWVTILPGDGQIDPNDLLLFFEQAENADLVTSLYKNRTTGLWRRAISLGLRLLTTVIVGTRARTEGTYLVRRTVLQELRPQSNSFLLNLEIPIRAKKRGYRIRTVQIHMRERIAGCSKAATFRRILQTFLELFRLRVRLEKEKWGNKTQE